MSLQTAGDLPLQITSENSSSERRVTPSWTIGQLKAKLEPVTGIPPLSQRLILKLPGQQPSVPLEAADEETTQLGSFPLAAYAEIHVSFAFLILLRFAKQSVIPLVLFWKPAPLVPNIQRRNRVQTPCCAPTYASRLDTTLPRARVGEDVTVSSYQKPPNGAGPRWIWSLTCGNHWV